MCAIGHSGSVSPFQWANVNVHYSLSWTLGIIPWALYCTVRGWNLCVVQLKGFLHNSVQTVISWLGCLLSHATAYDKKVRTSWQLLAMVSWPSDFCNRVYRVSHFVGYSVWVLQGWFQPKLYVKACMPRCLLISPLRLTNGSWIWYSSSISCIKGCYIINMSCSLACFVFCTKICKVSMIFAKLGLLCACTAKVTYAQS